VGFPSTEGVQKGVHSKRKVKKKKGPGTGERPKTAIPHFSQGDREKKAPKQYPEGLGKRAASKGKGALHDEDLGGQKPERWEKLGVTVGQYALSGEERGEDKGNQSLITRDPARITRKTPRGEEKKKNLNIKEKGKQLGRENRFREKRKKRQRTGDGAKRKKNLTTGDS